MTGILIAMVTLLLIESVRRWMALLGGEMNAKHGIAVCGDAVGGGAGMKILADCSGDAARDI